MPTRKPGASHYTLGVWDNDAQHFAYEQSGLRVWDTAKLLLRYGFGNVRALAGLVRQTLTKWERLYELQASTI